MDDDPAAMEVTDAASDAVGDPSDGTADDDSSSTAVPAARFSPLVLLVGVVAFAADQLSKEWAMNRLSDGSSIDVIGSLRFKLAFNTGMAFSLGTGRGWIFALVSLCVVGILLRASRSLHGWFQLVPVGLIAGGALGNVADRAFRSSDSLLGGRVVDFIDLQWWPVFNIADSCVVVGAIWLVLVLATSPDSTVR